MKNFFLKDSRIFLKNSRFCQLELMTVAEKRQKSPEVDIFCTKICPNKLEIKGILKKDSILFNSRSFQKNSRFCQLDLVFTAEKRPKKPAKWHETSLFEEKSQNWAHRFWKQTWSQSSVKETNAVRGPRKLWSPPAFTCWENSSQKDIPAKRSPSHGRQSEPPAASVSTYQFQTILLWNCFEYFNRTKKT